MIKERRFSPRYRCDFTVVVEIDNSPYEFAARNISITGVALQFTRDVKLALAGLGVKLDTGDQLNILLPVVNTQLPSISLGCQVQYVRRLSQESYLMGCQFVDLDKNTQGLIEQQVEHSRL